jgi:hypothetical protein
MTVLSIDTGDIQTIEKFAATGLITDATTNPLFGEHRFPPLASYVSPVGPDRQLSKALWNGIELALQLGFAVTQNIM